MSLGLKNKWNQFKLKPDFLIRKRGFAPKETLEDPDKAN